MASEYTFCPKQQPACQIRTIDEAPEREVDDLAPETPR